MPVDGPPIRDGRVVVEGGRVAWVGPAGDPAAPEGPVRDLGRGVLLPGLVNAHCHLELSHLAGGAAVRGGLRPLGRGAWWRAAARPPRTRCAPATAAAIALPRGAGHGGGGRRLEPPRPPGPPRRVALSAVVFLELLAWDPSRAAETEAWVDERLGAARAAALDPASRCAWPPTRRTRCPRISSAGWWRAAGPAALHLAESPDEAASSRDGSGAWAGLPRAAGPRPRGLRAPGDEPRALRRRASASCTRGWWRRTGCRWTRPTGRCWPGAGSHVVLCPAQQPQPGRGDGRRARARWPPACALCLGTDSLASVETLDVLDDAALLHRQFPALDPAAIVRMATARRGRGARPRRPRRRSPRGSGRRWPSPRRTSVPRIPARLPAVRRGPPAAAWRWHEAAPRARR